MTLSDEDCAEIVDSIESLDILDAVKKVDTVRYLLADGPHGEPPEIRTNLLRLHQLAMDFINRGMKDKAQEFFDLNEELADQLYDATEALEAAWKILEAIGEKYPEGLDDED